MKNLFALLCLLLVSSLAQAQVLDPVAWEVNAVEVSEGVYDLQFNAEIEEHWHLYSQFLDTTKIGPVPTEFIYEESAGVKFIGLAKEPTPIVDYDPNFEMDVPYFEGEATFTQRVELDGVEGANIVGSISFMTCDDSKCIFPEPAYFDLVIGDASKLAAAPAGILDPVHWTMSAEQVSDDEYDLVFKADIDEGWHLYSQDLGDKIGPVPTSFTFTEDAAAYSLVGETREGTPIVHFDPNFDMDLSFYNGEAEFVQRVKSKGDSPGVVEGYLSFMTCDDSKCLPPEDVDFAIDLKEATPGSRSLDSNTSNAKTDSGNKGEQKNMWTIFFIAFLSGFAALLTPCVFPMIPLTVSFFTKQSKTRAKGITNAILYGFFIIVIYVGLGVFVSAVFGADAMNKLATDPWFNIAFFILLVVFAASFLGAFEITLPNSWVNKADTASNRGGIIGIFFMALVLAIVSFSCTGPIVGTLLVEAAAGGSYFGPIIGMFGFSLAIALPFALFAAFPGWMNSLPQSGGWLNSVKVVLGFLELALAFKFLSNADIVLQAHWLEREVFLAIWIIIFGLLTMYLLGFIKMSHDSPMPHVSVTRLFLAIVTGAFTMYMIPGMWGAPLKLINAFPPPMMYSESPQGVGGGGGASISHGADATGTHPGPQGIAVFHDYDKGLAHAKKVGLPVMLDFTGHACVNCRKMEEQVWSNSAIKQSLSTDVVLISLYVDERIKLPESEQYEVELHGKTRKIRYTGDKWKLMQEKRYQINSQPYYVLIDHDEEMLIEAANYQDHGSVPVFEEWLTRGISKFKH